MDSKKISTEEMKHVAKLANLSLSDKELGKFSGQLSETINYVKKLNKLNTENVLPTSQTTGLKNVFREDEIKPSFSQKEALSNAKKTHKGFFVAKSVFD